MNDTTKDDTQKLHAEINQYINHCFVLSTTAITAFGILGGFILAESAHKGPETWNLSGTLQLKSLTGLISQAIPTIPPHMTPITFLLSGFSIALLLVLFFACKVTENNILVLAAYLRVISGSQWEKDMEALRKKGRPWFCHQNEFRHVLFGVLGIASIALPYIHGRSGPFQDNYYEIGHVAISAVATVVYALMIFEIICTCPSSIETTWTQIIETSPNHAMQLTARAVTAPAPPTSPSQEPRRPPQ